MDQAPLNTRAWVLQERLLTPRIIHFGANQLLWQCGIDALCEMYPTTSLDHLLGVDHTGDTDRDLRTFVPVVRSLQETPEDRLGKFALEEASRTWDTIVKTYSSMNLIKGEDKFIAIQAIAEAMQAAVPDRYIAVLWESRIIEDLLCHADPAMLKRTTRRPVQWGAPSWSCASLDGPVKKMTRPGRYVGRKQCDGEPIVQCIKGFVDGYIGKTTGQIKRARMEVRGYLYKCRRASQARCIFRHMWIDISQVPLPGWGPEASCFSC